MSLAIARLGADDRPHTDLRTLVEDDASNLASLMLCAYGGTADGGGSGPAVLDILPPFYAWLRAALRF